MANNDKKPRISFDKFIVLLFVIVAGGYLVFGSSDDTTPKPSEASSLKNKNRTSNDEIQSDSIKMGSDIKITNSYFACKSLDDLDKIKILANVDNDIRAAGKFGIDHQCKIINTGDVFVAKDFSLLHNSVCMRRKGDYACLWYPSPFVEASK